MARWTYLYGRRLSQGLSLLLRVSSRGNLNALAASLLHEA